MDQDEIIKGINLLEELFEIGAFDQKYKKIKVDEIIQMAKNKKHSKIYVPSEVFVQNKNKNNLHLHKNIMSDDSYHNYALSRTDCSLNSDKHNTTNMSLK